MSNLNQTRELRRLVSELSSLRESACQSGNCMKAPDDAKNKLLFARARLVLTLLLPERNTDNLVTSFRHAIAAMTQSSHAIDVTSSEDLPS